MCAIKSSIPDNISEEYYQISPEILASFPKYRPPLDLFKFVEDVAQLLSYSRKGQRLSNEQIEEVNQLCQDSNLFVSRSDHPVYSKHICKQLDLILLDKNLKESEIADIIVQALQLRLEAFFDQAVPPVFEFLYKDLMVVTEYLSSDSRRIKSLMRRIQTTHSLINHSINCGFVGLWMYLKCRNYEFVRRDLDRIAVALFLHDMGMCKIPQFILSKTIPLTLEERSKVNMHPILGLKIAEKLGLSFNEIKACILEHHERLDQSGYPRKVGGDEITKIGRLCAVVDSFCAMITDRPYAKAMTLKDAAKAISKDDAHYDTQFTLQLLSGFVANDW
jgi:HD-GYP domain-containing protein (c-di-GMP phosphodiesterase class II)